MSGSRGATLLLPMTRSAPWMCGAQKTFCKQGVVVTSVAQPRPSPRFVCRSYMAVALAPEPPLLEWIAEIEQKIKDTGNFLVGLALSAVRLSRPAIAHLVAQLEQRGVRVMGVENVDPSQLDAALPPLLR